MRDYSFSQSVKKFRASKLRPKVQSCGIAMQMWPLGTSVTVPIANSRDNGKLQPFVIIIGVKTPYVRSPKRSLTLQQWPTCMQNISLHPSRTMSTGLYCMHVRLAHAFTGPTAFKILYHSISLSHGGCRLLFHVLEQRTQAIPAVQH